MAIRLMATKILLLISQVFKQQKDSYYYLLIDSDTLENIVDLIDKEGGRT